MPRLSPTLVVQAGLLAFCFLFPRTAFAEEVRSNVRSWRLEQGLPDNFVNQVVQDKRGFLWVGTEKGLARFDSVNFKEYRDPQNSADFGFNIRDLAVTPDGTVLTLPASGGVVAWKNNKASVHPMSASLGNAALLDLFVEPSGAIWVAAAGPVIFRWENGSIQRFSREDGINRRVNRVSFSVDGQGQTWIATGEFLGLYKDGRLIPSTQPIKDIGTAILIAPSHSGGLWVSSAERLMHLEKDQATSVCESPIWLGRRAGIQCLCEDSSGRLWIGTRRDGLYLYGEGQLRKVALESRAIHSILEDGEGNIWVGTAGEGLARLRPQSFTILNRKSGFLEDTSTSICGDSSGALWCANRSGGLARYKDGAVQYFGGNKLFASRVALDRKGDIWVAASNGLVRLSGENLEKVDPVQPSTSGIHILHESQAGDMWMASALGLGYFHEGVYQNVLSEAERSRYHLDRVEVLAENKKGEIWIAGSEFNSAKQRARLVVYSEGVIREEGPGDDWSSGPIQTLFFDHNDLLWIGSAGGLVLKQGNKLTHFTKAQGLPDDFVTQIQEDATGYLWMAGRRALFRVKIENLRAVAEGKASRVDSAVFEEEVGLQSVSALGGGQPRSWKTSDGRIWFTLHRGVVGVDPAMAVVHRDAPPLYIDEISLDQQVIPIPSSRLEVPPDTQQIKLRFAVLDFSHPEHVVLRYKLEGLDLDWIDAVSDRTARYSHLGPGHYRLVVQAANPNGSWKERETSLTVDVAASWWQTRWFRATAALLAAALIAWAARLRAVRKFKTRLQRLEREHAIERERVRIARNLHDELGGSLTQIGLLAERLKRHRNMEEIDKTLGLLIRRTQGLAVDLESIVWTVSPQNNSWDRLAVFIGRYARLFFEGSGIECRIEGVDTVPAVPLALEAQHEVLAICKEAMNNVLKHSKASCVTVRFSLIDNVFEIKIQDDGAGFEPGLKEHSERNGLNNMRVRADEMKGSVAIESRLAAGTLINLRVPI